MALHKLIKKGATAKDIVNLMEQNRDNKTIGTENLIQTFKRQCPLWKYPENDVRYKVIIVFLGHGARCWDSAPCPFPGIGHIPRNTRRGLQSISKKVEFKALGAGND